MSPRRLVMLLVCGVVLLAVLLAARKFHYFLVTNKAIYLTNRHELHEAQALLEYVVNNDPDNFRARRVLAQVEIDVGNYADAELLLVGLGTSPEIQVEKAICDYENDREDAAIDELEQIATPNKTDKKHDIHLLAENAIRVLRGERPDPEFLQLKPENFSRGYRRFLLSLQSRVALAGGEFAKARELSARAIALGDRNSVGQRVGVISCAATLDLSKAQYYADTSFRRPFDWSATLSDLTRLSDKITTQTVATEMTSLFERQRLALAAAKAWALLQLAQASKDTSLALESASVAKSVVDSMPFEVRYTLLYADALISADQPTEAYQMLQKWNERHNSYSVELRLADLAGLSIDDVTERFAQVPYLVACLKAEDFLTTKVVRKKNILAFYEAGVCEASFSVPSAGQFFIVLTARGDRAFGLSPLVALRLDSKTADYIYIAREDWDAYEVAVELEPGIHSLAVEYVNNSERLPSNEEDRNFYLHNVMITRAEGDTSGTYTDKQ